MLPNDRLIYCNVLAAQNLEELGRSTAAAGRCSESSGNIPHTTVVTGECAFLYPEQPDTTSLFCIKGSARQTTFCLPKMVSAAPLLTFLLRIGEMLLLLLTAVLE